MFTTLSYSEAVSAWECAYENLSGVIELGDDALKTELELLTDRQLGQLSYNTFVGLIRILYWNALGDNYTLHQYNEYKHMHDLAQRVIDTYYDDDDDSL